MEAYTLDGSPVGLRLSLIDPKGSRNVEDGDGRSSMRPVHPYVFTSRQRVEQ